VADILATTDDVNANLDNNVQVPEEEDLTLLQISIARSVKAYLSRVLTWTTLNTWTDPDTTPDIVREIAAKLIAAQYYYQKISTTTYEVPTTSYAQVLYNQAMEYMNMIISGEIVIPDVPETPTEGMSTADFWPVDDTARAFTMSKNFYGQNN
jgi:hypothetical protein